MTIDLGLVGNRALVTGAAVGIGRGIARWLAAAGCDVAIADAGVWTHVVLTAICAMFSLEQVWLNEDEFYEELEFLGYFDRAMRDELVSLHQQRRREGDQGDRRQVNDLPQAQFLGECWVEHHDQLEAKERLDAREDHAGFFQDVGDHPV